MKAHWALRGARRDWRRGWLLYGWAAVGGMLFAYGAADSLVGAHSIASAALPTALASPTASAATAPGAKAPPPQSVDLIARDLLLGPPDRTAATVSPNGKLIAFLAPVEGVANVWVAPIGGIDKAHAVTQSGKRPIATYYWAPDSSRILYLQDHDGDENNQLFGVIASSHPANDAVNYTPFAKTNTQIVAASPLVPDAILVSLNRRDPHWPDVYRLNLTTGALQLLWTNPGGYRNVIADAHLRLRLAEKVQLDGGYQIDRFLSDGSLRQWLVTGFDDSQTTAVVSVAAGGTTAYLLDSRGRDTSALETLDLETGAKRLLAQNAHVDIASNSDGGVGGELTLIIDPRTGEVQAYSVNDLTLEWMAVGPALQKSIEFLDSHAGGQWSVVSQSGDNLLWTVSVERPGEAVLYALFDRKAQTLSTLFSARPRLEGMRLSKMQPLELQARDGKRLVGYLSVPVATQTPMPAVLLIHGGPDERNVYGYNGYHQWLTNRGYAVLSVNYRGSTGFGKAFTNSRAWSTEVSNDLLDGIDWLTSHGVATPDRIAIMGSSYGGYAVLAGLTSTPRVYACGVDGFGPTDLPGLLSRDSVLPDWNANYEHLVRVFGDPRTPEGRHYLEERSPQTHVNQLVHPLLVAQGANDPRVRKVQSDRFVDALERRHVAVTYVVFPDEGHGFAREVNSLAFAAISEAFLHQCLGGALEPFGTALAGSSVQIPVGAARIEGLTAAFAKH